MPEGDTIFRTARTLRTWLVGHEITGARTAGPARSAAAGVRRLVGQTVEEVDARAKHLLIRCSGNLTLHTHMKMTGAWHVYSAGERWRRPQDQVRVVLEAGERVAVCFSAPVVEVIDRRAEHLHPALAQLGPDVLDPPIDLDEVRRRAAARPADLPIADLLLDQGVVSGIGNIWRSETLFVERVDPSTPRANVDPETLNRLVTTASALMIASVEGRRPEPSVYRRAERPCRRCGTPISAKRYANGRTVWWCPRCQAP